MRVGVSMASLSGVEACGVFGDLSLGGPQSAIPRLAEIGRTYRFDDTAEGQRRAPVLINLIKHISSAVLY